MEYSHVVKFIGAQTVQGGHAQAKKHLKLDVRHVDESGMPPAEFIDQLGVVGRKGDVPSASSGVNVLSPPAGGTCSQRRVELEILSGKSG